MSKLLANLKIYLLTLLTPVQRVMQKLGKPEPRMRKAHVDAIMAHSRVGDILLSHEDYRLTNGFIRGYWDHAAIIGPNSTVIEAVGTGVRQVDLEQWLYQKDDVCLIRVNCDALIAFKAGTTALIYINRAYDYLFSFGADKIYCSELVWICYKDLISGFMRPVVAKNSQILPEHYFDFAVANNGLQLLYNTKGA